MKIAICDDDLYALGHMKKIILEYEFYEKVEVNCFLSGIELLDNAILKKYDIVIIDIELSDDERENGMAISNKIKNAYPNVIVIFITGVAGYERKLLNFEPFRFINKPIKRDSLIYAVQAAMSRIKGWDKHFGFKFNGITILVEIRKIMFFMSQSPYIIIKCIDDETRFRGKIDCVEKQISKLTDDFIRISKSCLINKCFIKARSSKEIILTSGEIIAVTRKYAKNLDKLEDNK